MRVPSFSFMFNLTGQFIRPSNRRIPPVKCEPCAKREISLPVPKKDSRVVSQNATPWNSKVLDVDFWFSAVGYGGGVVMLFGVGWWVLGLGLSRLTCKIKVDSHNEDTPGLWVLNEILRQTMTVAAGGWEIGSGMWGLETRGYQEHS